ncbi:hypothetical protein K2X92_06235 [Candidatus Gracilibacteria bacterium]|nr:hypothetical protein [Candidatus Gracilibacteria bacterium]
MLFGDLHFHSTNSDGVKTSAERIQHIRFLDSRNEHIWAQTDHDCYSPNFVEPARELGIKAIWATEISAHSSELDCSFHVTCYSPTLSESIKSRIDAVLIGKTAKVREQIKKLQTHGFDINEVEFFSWAIARGYRPIAVSNVHLSDFLLDEKRNSHSLSLLSDLTEGTVTTLESIIRECLRESGTYSHIGAVVVPPYEPEISDLIQVANSEGIVLSVAHPNFSFHPLYKKHGINLDPIARSKYFHDKILPILLGIGMKNFEINAKATREQVEYLVNLVKRTGGMNTFGSDNHGSPKEGNKHGIFAHQNELLTPEIAKPITDKLLSFV